MRAILILWSVFVWTVGTAQIKMPPRPTKVEEHKPASKFDKVLVKAMLNNNNKTTLEVGNNTSNSKSETIKQPPVTTKQNGRNCTSSITDYNVATADFGYFLDNGTPEFIKPGVLMAYEDVLSGSNKIMTTPRNPLTIYLERTSAAVNVSNLNEVINNPHQVSNINNALGKMNAKISTNVPAQMAIEVSEISSEEQLQYGVSGSYNNKMAGIGAKFNISGSDFKSSYYYMVKFTQSMYKIAVDDATFAFTNPASVLNTDKLVYISEVIYGRKGFLLIKTKKSKSALEASLGVNLSVGVHAGNLSAFLNKVKEDKESQVNMFFYGGNASAAAMSIQNVDIKNGFDNWIAANAGEGLKALPISYKLKNMNGDQLVLKSAFTVNQQTCVPVKEYKLQVELEQVKNYKSNDSDKKDDYVFDFEPVLVIDGTSYPLQNKQLTTKQSIISASNHLFVRDRNNPANQLHVNEGNTQQIKNSGVFVIPEDVNLKNAKLQIRFRVHEITGNSLDRIIGISKVQDYNIHDHSLIDIISVLTGATTLDARTYTQCNANCRGTKFGNFGGNTKYFLANGTVPLEYGNSTTALRGGEYMRNETETRTFGLNYTFKLLD